MKRCPRCKELVAADDFVFSVGYCKPCNRARAREWQEKNRERRRATRRSYDAKNRESVNAKKLAEYHALMARDPERIRKRRREWVKTEKGVIANRSARHKRRGAELDTEAREWAAILLHDPCSYCGEPAVELDHIDALSEDGDGTWMNLTSSCRRCNARKNDRSLLASLH